MSKKQIVPAIPLFPIVTLLDFAQAIEANTNKGSVSVFHATCQQIHSMRFDELLKLRDIMRQAADVLERQATFLQTD